MVVGGGSVAAACEMACCRASNSAWLETGAGLAVRWLLSAAAAAAWNAARVVGSARVELVMRGTAAPGVGLGGLVLRRRVISQVTSLWSESRAVIAAGQALASVMDDLMRLLTRMWSMEAHSLRVLLTHVALWLSLC